MAEHFHSLKQAKLSKVSVEQSIVNLYRLEISDNFADDFLEKVSRA